MIGPKTNRYRLLIGYARPQWPIVAVIAGLMVITASIAALQPLPLKLLVDYGLRGTPLPDWIRVWFVRVGLDSRPVALVIIAALLGILVFAVNSALDAALTWAWSVAGQRMVYKLAGDLYRKLLRLSLLYHSRRSVGDSISRLTGDTWCVYTFVSGFLMGPIHQILVLASVAIVAFSLDRHLAWVSLGMAPLLAFSSVFFGRRLKTRAKQSRQADVNLLSFVQQTLTAISVVQAFAAENRNRQRFGALADDVISLSKKAALLSGSFGMVNGVISTLGTATILLFGGKRVLDGNLPLGSLLVFLAYMQTLHSGVEGLLKLYAGFKPLEASIERIAETMQCPEFIPEAIDAVELPPILAGVGGHVRLENVTFGYDAGRPVLQEIDLEAKPGELIALVGHTGAGKSTLASLIPRLFDPWSGAVIIDGRDVRSVRIADVRSRVSVLLQEPFLFPVSVAENIALGRPAAHRDEVIAAAKSSGAHAFIQSLPNGYDTVLGERGATLSGGERQRIAIARAFLRNAPILILDEPSSALDSQTEKSLLDALDILTDSRTAFIIAHRLSTIRRADKIVVLEDGRIVETGTHGELLAAGGPYARYHAAQFTQASQKVPA